MVRRLLKSAQQRQSGPASTDNIDPPSAESSGTRVASDNVGTEKTQKNMNGKRGGKPARKKRPPAGGEGRPKEESGREGGGRALVPSWLFAHMPFYDDESFAVFFCEVLRGSERLAVRFS